MALLYYLADERCLIEFTKVLTGVPPLDTSILERLFANTTTAVLIIPQLYFINIDPGYTRSS
jgi:hypothetical protein